MRSDRLQLGVMILGAGASRRMGHPKLLLPWGKTSVLGHLLEVWRSLQAHQIGVVCAAGDALMHNELTLLGFSEDTCIINPDPRRGMFSSIQCAAAWKGWKPEITHWAIVLGDQPHLHPQTLRLLLDFAASHPNKNCQPSRNGHARHPVVLPKNAFRLLQNTNATNLKEFLAAEKEHAQFCESDDPGLDFDLDTPEDYKKAWEMFGKF